MTNREIIRELKCCGYRRVNIDTDRRAARTFYTYRRSLHINGTENLSFHIVPQKESLGLGRFAVCAVKNGAGSQLGTDHAPFFFQRILPKRKDALVVPEADALTDKVENPTNGMLNFTEEEEK